MREYSLIKDKTHHDLIIWDEYLVYSVLFNLNNIIVEKISKLVDIEYVKYTPR